jgi:hypothetical protein
MSSVGLLLVVLLACGAVGLGLYVRTFSALLRNEPNDL